MKSSTLVPYHTRAQTVPIHVREHPTAISTNRVRCSNRNSPSSFPVSELSLSPGRARPAAHHQKKRVREVPGTSSPAESLLADEVPGRTPACFGTLVLVLVLVSDAAIEWLSAVETCAVKIVTPVLSRSQVSWLQARGELGPNLPGGKLVFESREMELDRKSVV